MLKNSSHEFSSLITTQIELKAFCSAFADQPFIVVDTEFMREKTYWPILCLIQAAAPGVEGMIDPLAEGLDLSPFLDILADSSITKVFHAARQDLEIFYNLMKKVPAPLFDSQIAAMACGFGDQIGYEPLMRELVKANIDKGSRFTDWSRRPLTQAQLTYALSDVTHLRDAYPILKARLKKDNRNHWVEEELAMLDDPSLYFIEPEKAWMRLKLRNTKPKELGPLVKLAQWREQEAQSKNVPRGRIMKDDGLFELARMRPLEADSLSRARSIPKGFERSESAKGILEAIKTGNALPKDKLPSLKHNERKTPPPADVIDLLRVLLKHTCEHYQVAPKLIASASDLEALARSDKAPIPAMSGWRFEIFGEKALQLKRGEISLKLQNGKLEVTSV